MSDNAARETKETKEGSLNPNDKSSQGMALAVFLVFVASVICFSTAADYCANSNNCSDNGRLEFTLAAGIVSAFLTFCWLIMRFASKIELSAVIELIFACFLTIWWAVTAGVATSAEGPFSATGNGYFSTWAALIMAVLYLAHAYVRKFGNAHTEIHHHAISFIFMASIVELCVAIDVCSDNDCTNREAFAIAVGAISIIGCLLQFAIAHWGSVSFAQKHGAVWGIFFVIVWSFGAGFNTSVDGPFTLSCNSANGYFATWIAFAASVAYAFRIIAEKIPAADA